MPVVSEDVRALVSARAGGICEYCRYPEEFSAGRFSVDHVLPRSQGGTNEMENLAFACRSCNEHKQRATTAYDPATAQITALFHPRNDRWTEHFAWSSDFHRMAGLTAKGRATIQRLQTNHAGVVRQREVLRKLGLHPVSDAETADDEKDDSGR